MFIVLHAMFRGALRLLAASLFWVAVATGAAAQGEAPGEGPKSIQIKLDLLDVLAQARQAVRDREMEKAVGLYRFILRFAPDLKIAQVELSFALAALGERDRAARLLRDIDREGLDPSVIAAIDRIIGPDRLKFFLVPSLIIDNNINGQTKKDVILINGIPFTLSEDAKGRAAYGYGLTVGAGYRLLDSAPRTTLTAGVRMRDLTARRDDTLDLFGSLSFAFRAGPRTVVTPSLSAAYRTKADASLELEHAGGMSVRFPLGPVRTTLGGRYRVIEGRGDKKGELDRRRSEVDTGLGYGFSGLGMRFDGKLFREDWLENETQDNEGFKTGLDLIFVDTPWVTPTLGGSLTFTGYENKASFFNIRRLDRDYEGHIEFTFRDLDILGFDPVFRYTYRHSTSNIPLFDYNEHEFSVGFKALTF